MTDHAHELRRYARKIGYPAGDVPAVMLAAADEIERLQARVDAAEKSDAESIAMYRKARDERDALRAAMEKIADWYGAWGPYPETNKSWCAMAIVTAREAVKPLTNLCAKGE